jgi:hypothetical protein
MRQCGKRLDSVQMTSLPRAEASGRVIPLRRGDEMRTPRARMTIVEPSILL